MTLGELLAIKKRVVGYGKARSKAQPTQEQYDFELEANLSEGQVAGFIRICRVLPESFSIGLTFRSEAVATRTLLRVNGDHGGAHRNHDLSMVANAPHIHHHPAERGNWDVARLSIDAKYAEALDPPLTLPMAWEVFCERANVIDSGGIRGLVSGLHAILAAQMDLELP